MSKKQQRDSAVVADELKQEFVKAERDRDTAIHALTGRSWRAGESPASFAHDICCLAKLAYPGFDADALDTIARDCFLKELPPELREALRRDPQTTTKKVQDLAAEVVRLQLAGVGSTTPQTARVAQATVTDPDASHASPSLVDQIAEQIYHLMTDHDDGTSEMKTSHVQVVRHKTAPSRGRYSGYSNSGPKMQSRISTNAPSAVKTTTRESSALIATIATAV